MYCISSVIRWICFLQYNPKNLDLSYKMDLDLWDCLGINMVCEWPTPVRGSNSVIWISASLLNGVNK